MCKNRACNHDGANKKKTKLHSKKRLIYRTIMQKCQSIAHAFLQTRLLWLAIVTKGRLRQGTGRLGLRSLQTEAGGKNDALAAGWHQEQMDISKTSPSFSSLLEAHLC